MIKQKAPYHKRMPKKVEGIKCPRCDSEDLRKNGSIRNKKTGIRNQAYWCTDCGYTFSKPKQYKVTP